MSRLSTLILRDLAATTPIFTTADAAAAGNTTVQLASRGLRRMADAGLVVRLVRGLWGVPRHPHFSPYALVPYLLRHDTMRQEAARAWSDLVDVGDDNDEDADYLPGGGPQRAGAQGVPFSMKTSEMPQSVAGYVSFISAMHLHGMLSQIPREIHVAVRQQRKPVVTPVASYQFHQVGRDLFGGAAPGDAWGRFHIATPAKSLVDTLYVATRRGRRFRHLPEVELPNLDSMAREDVNRRWASRAAERFTYEERLAAFDHEVTRWLARIAYEPVRAAVGAQWRALRSALVEQP